MEKDHKVTELAKQIYVQTISSVLLNAGPNGPNNNTYTFQTGPIGVTGPTGPIGATGSAGPYRIQQIQPAPPSGKPDVYYKYAKHSMEAALAFFEEQIGFMK